MFQNQSIKEQCHSHFVLRGHSFLCNRGRLRFPANGSVLLDVFQLALFGTVLYTVTSPAHFELSPIRLLHVVTSGTRTRLHQRRDQWTVSIPVPFIDILSGRSTVIPSLPHGIPPVTGAPPPSISALLRSVELLQQIVVIDDGAVIIEHRSSSRPGMMQCVLWRRQFR